MQNETCTDAKSNRELIYCLYKKTKWQKEKHKNPATEKMNTTVKPPKEHHRHKVNCYTKLSLTNCTV